MQAPQAVTLISAVQGAGAASPLVGETVTVEAIVTSLFTNQDAPDGFFVQEEDADADSSDSTSEGHFIFCRGACPRSAPGDLVRVRRHRRRVLRDDPDRRSPVRERQHHDALDRQPAAVGGSGRTSGAGSTRRRRRSKRSKAWSSRSTARSSSASSSSSPASANSCLPPTPDRSSSPMTSHRASPATTRSSPIWLPAPSSSTTTTTTRTMPSSAPSDEAYPWPEGGLETDNRCRAATRSPASRESCTGRSPVKADTDALADPPDRSPRTTQFTAANPAAGEPRTSAAT